MMIYCSASFAEGYQLTCVFDGVDGAGVNVFSAQNKIVIGKSFKQSDKPASMGVNPGYCAWQDRGFRPGEPTMIAEEAFNSMSYYEIQYKGTTQIVLAPNPWTAWSKVPGKQVIFNVVRGTVLGTAGDVLKIVNK